MNYLLQAQWCVLLRVRQRPRHGPQAGQTGQPRPLGAGGVAGGAGAGQEAGHRHLHGDRHRVRGGAGPRPPEAARGAAQGEVVFAASPHHPCVTSPLPRPWCRCCSWAWAGWPTPAASPSPTSSCPPTTRCPTSCWTTSLTRSVASSALNEPSRRFHNKP